VLAWGEKYTRGVLAALPELRVIARIGVGLDSVDIPAATERGIAVTVTPTANHEAVAEHAMALLFAAAKSIPRDDKATRAGEWPIQMHQPVRGKTLGIVGLGRIGRDTAVRALAMRMRVIATEKYPDQAFVEQHGIELMELDALLTRSDYVSLHCPLTEETRGLINRQRLAQMRPDSVLINTARGGLVVEEHLLEALTAGQLRGAALDVFEREPVAAANPLLQLDNVVVSAHTAGIDTLAMENMGIEAAQCIIDLSRGQWPDEAAVNGDLKKAWKW
jgi:phosphoglycerate dehydrogenase-like enzyme